MDPFQRVVQGNRSYARRQAESDPQLWQTLAEGQQPEVLWIGCGDSRVPETTICDCKPGDIFVHRNIANIIVPNDVNSGSLVQYAVGALQVKRIILCGHTKCGGAINSLIDSDLGPELNQWLQPLRNLRRKHQSELDRLDNDDQRAIRLAELNVRQGVEVLKSIPIIQSAMAERGLTVHGVIFDLTTGQLRVLEEDVPAPAHWQHR